MSAREARALREIKKLREEQAKLSQRIIRIRARFKANCTHSQTQPYHWEHDNGYGRQSKIEGLMCLLCKKVKPWPSATTWQESVYSE